MANVNLYRAKAILAAAATGRVGGSMYGDSTMAINTGRIGSYQNAAFDGLASPYTCWGGGPFSVGGYRATQPWLAFITPTAAFTSNATGGSIPTLLTDTIPPDLTMLGTTPINGGYVALDEGASADWANRLGPTFDNSTNCPSWWPFNSVDMRFHFSFLELAATHTPQAHFNLRLQEQGTTATRVNDFYADGTLYGPGEGDPLHNGHVCDGLADAWKYGYLDAPAGQFAYASTGFGVGWYGRDMGASMATNEGCNGVIAFRSFFLEYPNATAGLAFAEHYIGGGLDATECNADLDAYCTAAQDAHDAFYADFLHYGGAGTKFLIFLGFGENDASGAAMKTAYEAIMARIRTTMATIGVPVGDYVFVLVSPHDWDGFPDHGFRSVCDDLANEYSDVCHADPSVNVSEADISAVNGFDTGDGTVYNAHLADAGDNLNALEGVFNPILASVAPGGVGGGAGKNRSRARNRASSTESYL